MKTILILCTWLFTACEFDPSGLPSEDSPDCGSVDTDAGPDQDGGTDAFDAAFGTDAAYDIDAAPVAPPTIVCTQETIDGQTKQVLTFGGDVEAGFLTDPVPAAGAVPVAIEYGSEIENPGHISNCTYTWQVPYPAGCSKPRADWVTVPRRLILELEVDRLNVALRYSDGTVRWGDLKTDDGDAPGFEVSGSGPGFNCRIEVDDGGHGGSFHIDP